MQPLRTRFSSRRLIVAIVAMMVVAFDFSTSGIHAVCWEVPLFGALLSRMAVRSRSRLRLAPAVAGGAISGLCVYFLYSSLVAYQVVKLLPTSNPFIEAVAGGILGAVIGAAASLSISIFQEFIALSSTVKGMLMIVAFSAVLMFVASFMRADNPDRLFITLVAVLMGLPTLLLVEYCRKPR